MVPTNKKHNRKVILEPNKFLIKDLISQYDRNDDSGLTEENIDITPRNSDNRGL